MYINVAATPRTKQERKKLIATLEMARRLTDLAHYHHHEEHFTYYISRVQCACSHCLICVTRVFCDT